MEAAIMASFTSYDAVLTEAGYRPAEPSANAAAVDRETVAGAVCVGCGWRGLEYRPYLRFTERDGRSYRALAVCPTCGEAFEF